MGAVRNADLRLRVGGADHFAGGGWFVAEHVCPGLVAVACVKVFKACGYKAVLLSLGADDILHRSVALCTFDSAIAAANEKHKWQGNENKNLLHIR